MPSDLNNIFYERQLYFSKIYTEKHIIGFQFTDLLIFGLIDDTSVSVDYIALFEMYGETLK